MRIAYEMMYDQNRVSITVFACCILPVFNVSFTVVYTRPTDVRTRSSRYSVVHPFCIFGSSREICPENHPQCKVLNQSGCRTALVAAVTCLTIVNGLVYIFIAIN